MDKMTVFVALTGVAVLLQACVLLAMYLTMRKGRERMEALGNEVKTKVLPTVEQVQEVLSEMRPKLLVVMENLEQTTTLLKSEVERVDATVSDAMDRARLQIIRGDELLTRTMDRVEHTTDVVQRTVVSPFRQISGLMQGLTAGLEFLFSQRSHRNGGSREDRRPVPQDELFI